MLLLLLFFIRLKVIMVLVFHVFTYIYFNYVYKLTIVKKLDGIHAYFTGGQKNQQQYFIT